MSSIWFALILLCQIGLCLPAQAKQPFENFGDDLSALYGDEETVSIATGSKKLIYKAPAVATVITAEQMKTMGARQLDDVLETVPGLHIVPSSINRLNSTYAIRGNLTGMNPHVLFLINGVPFPLLANGSRPNNFHLPLAAVSRIEVLRGPGSAIYGADAFSGVINIITKDAQEVDGTETGVRYGSFDSHDLWLEHGSRMGEVDVMFSLEWQKSDGDRDRRIDSDLQTAFDQAYATAASHAPGPLETGYDVVDLHLELQLANWTLRNWFWRLQDGGVGAGAAQALDPTGHDDIASNLIDLSWQDDQLFNNWALSANLNHYYLNSKTDFVLFPPGATLPIGADGNLNPATPVGSVSFPDGLLGRPDALDRQLGLDLTAVFSGISFHRLRLGAGAKYQEEQTWESKNFGPGVIDGTLSPIDGTLTDVSNTRDVYQPDSDRTLYYLSLQDEWQLAPDWELTCGIRYDEYSDFGSTINPRIALVWATDYNLTSKFLYGRAFRPPSFAELYAQNNPVDLGNRSLAPETVDTFEIAFDYRPTLTVQTNLSLFNYRAHDLIEYVQDSSGVSKTAQNARNQEGYGFEFEFAWDLTKQLYLTGNYAWQHAEDSKSGKRIAKVPGQQLMLATTWEFLPEWQLRPQLNWIGKRHREAGDERSKLDDYTLVDLTLRKSRILKSFDLRLAVRNLFDEDAREPSDSVIPGDFPLEGRSFWAELSYRF